MSLMDCSLESKERVSEDVLLAARERLVSAAMDAKNDLEHASEDIKTIDELLAVIRGGA